MRSWLSLLLMFVVSLQFAWTAAANYCWHEPNMAGPAHLGHHVHQDDGAHAQAHKSLGKAAQSQADLDHGQCHLVGAVVVAELSLPQVLPRVQAPPVEAGRPAKSHIPEGLERPNWQRA